MITFENLSFSYGNTGEEQLNSLDLQIKKGDILALLLLKEKKLPKHQFMKYQKM